MITPVMWVVESQVKNGRWLGLEGFQFRATAVRMIKSWHMSDPKGKFRVSKYASTRKDSRHE